MSTTPTRPSPTLRLSDEMVDRAARAIHGYACGCQRPWPIDADHAEMARAALLAAFEDVPMSNFAIGLLLQTFDRVIVTREGAHDVAGMAFVANGPDGFDGVEHTMRTQMKAGGPRGMFVRMLSFTFEPPEARDAV